MEKINRLFSVLLFGFALLVASPVLAQDNDRDRDRIELRDDRDRDNDRDDLRDDDDNQARGDNNDDDGDGGGWGLLGLLGLAGLLGLRKRHDDHRPTITGTTHRPDTGGTMGTGSGSTIINP